LHDWELAERLRAGDEAAFREIVTAYGGRLARLARSFSRNDAVIEEAVQETWLAVIRGIDGFEGRAPLRSWIFGILVNQARRLAVREHRQAQIASGSPTGSERSASGAEDDDREPGMGRNGMWAEPPVPWGLEDPESAILSRETLAVIEATLADLPELQRQVVLLRDVEGLGPEDVCNILGINDTYQRVLLHRGRSKVRGALDHYLAGDAPSARRGKTRR
jgi:RNA polymerase sigma-70 factor, ECF subfamily